MIDPKPKPKPDPKILDNKLKNIEKVLDTKLKTTEKALDIKPMDTNKLLQMSQIGVWIDHYDDIFSDFDPRPFSERALSVDFLEEARRASRDKKTGQIELRFLISELARDRKVEPEIRKRLHGHFNNHLLALQSDQKKIVYEGRNFAILGIIVMLAATWLHFTFAETTILISFLVVVFEPAGWFLFWSGCDKMVFDSKKLKPELDFYEKMTKCQITFMSYK